MNENLIDDLEKYFGYKEDEKPKTLERFRNMTPEDRLKEAKEYLDWAKRCQNGAGSDFSYWAYGGDIERAGCLVEVFKYALKHQVKLPPIPHPKYNNLRVEIKREYPDKPELNFTRYEFWSNGASNWLFLVFKYLNNPWIEDPYKMRWIKLLKEKTDYFNGIEFEVG